MILGRSDFIRVPFPAARMTAAKEDWFIDSAQRKHERAIARRCHQPGFLLVFDLEGIGR